VPRPPEIDRRHYFLGGPVKVGLTPVSADAMYMFVLERTDKKTRQDPELLPGLVAAVAGYGGVLADIRESLDASDQIVFRPLEGFLLPAPWHSAWARTLLIGDAAHPTTPQLASGAGMAVEDALVLAEELRSAAVPDALRAFMARRWDRCRLVVENSMKIGQLEQQRAPIAAQTELAQASLRTLAAPI
jgi:2-polyprenyl-6-methoxyphenol hydroxylase-like FAD-dependent oxidoreductase